MKKNMRRIMKSITAGTYNPNHGSDDDLECLNECLQRGYVNGFDLDRNQYGNLIGQIIHPRITYQGYKFLDERFPNLRSNIAIVISVLALVLSALVAFTPFPEFTKTFITTIFKP